MSASSPESGKECIMYQMMIDSPHIKNTTQNSPGNSHRTSARRIASIIAPRSSPWKTPYIVNSKITTRKTVFTIIFFLLCTAFPPPSFQYHAIPCTKMRAFRYLPRHFCQKRSATYICNHMLLCCQRRDKHGKCCPQREPLIPARNLPSSADCHIAEPAVQAVNRGTNCPPHPSGRARQAFDSRIPVPRLPRPYVRCWQQQIKCHTDKPRHNICCKEPPDKFFLSLAAIR